MADTWTHSFDFTRSACGFEPRHHPDGQLQGHWVSGSGWHADLRDWGSPTNHRHWRLYIQRCIRPSHISHIEADFHNDVSLAFCTSYVEVTGQTFDDWYPTTQQDVFTWGADPAQDGVDTVYAYIEVDAAASDAYVTALRISGTGVDPFEELVPTWSHTFDFTENDGGWEPYPFLGIQENGPQATYVQGSGWHGINQYWPSPVSRIQWRCVITRTISPACQVTHFEATFQTGTDANPNLKLLRWSSNGQTCGNTQLGLITMSVNNLTAGIDELDVYMEQDPADSGECHITRAEVSGIGPDPLFQHEGAVCEANYTGIDAEETEEVSA